MKGTEITQKLVSSFREKLTSEINATLDDFDCGRFLTARTLDPTKASDMATNWFNWYNQPLPRVNVAPKDILNINEGLDPEEDVYRQHMPHSNVGNDKKGNPIYWEETGLISGRFKLFKSVLNEDALFVRHIRQQELMIKRMNAQTARLGRKIEKQVVVFNMKGLTYTLDQTALNVFLKTVKIDESCYPQRLETLYIINSPWFFRAIWALVSPFIDPVTATKIRILGGDYLRHLRDAIDDDQIPAEWGGSKSNFPWQYPANYSEALPEDIASTPSVPLAAEDAECDQEGMATEDFPKLDAEDVPPADLDDQIAQDMATLNVT